MGVSICGEIFMGTVQSVLAFCICPQPQTRYKPTKLLTQRRVEWRVRGIKVKANPRRNAGVRPRRGAAAVPAPSCISFAVAMDVLCQRLVKLPACGRGTTGADCARGWGPQKGTKCLRRAPAQSASVRAERPKHGIPASTKVRAHRQRHHHAGENEILVVWRFSPCGLLL
jgi:hypothetical protein